MKVTLPDFTNASVLIVGDIMLDRYWSGSTHRISPEAPVPVVKIKKTEERPGGAANVAMNIAALGGGVELLGLTGIDEVADTLERYLTHCKIACDFVRLKTHPTITKLRILSRHQQLLRLDFEEGFATAPKEALFERMQQKLPKYKAVVFSDYGKGTLDEVQNMIQLVKKVGLPILIDPKGIDFERYRGATLLTPNLSEFEAVVGKCENDDELVDKGVKLIERLDLEALLVTRSEKGMTLLQKNRTALHLPTLAQEVYDVTGAGDTVIAVLAATLASGHELNESCFLANAAAGVVVGKLGTSTVSLAELENTIRGRTNIRFGIMDEFQLKKAIVEARERGEKIVMTNGCFDILHAGHVSYLGNARKMGDRLIVAVNSDASTRRLKGSTRPINPLEQRMIVLSALESVDWVVDFTEDTPQRVIAELLPDILVKGGDYQVEDIAGGKEVIAAGGEVAILNFEEGCSTTNMIRRIQEDSK